MRLARTWRSEKRLVMKGIMIYSLAKALVVVVAEISELQGTELQITRKLLFAEKAVIPYRAPKLFQVGGAGVAWTVPPTLNFFANRAATLTFRPGDGLKFNKPISGYVDSVPAASYSNCSNDGYYEYWGTSNVDELFIQLEAQNADSMLYFIHEAPTNNCTKGLKFAAKVGSVVVPNPPAQPANTTNLQGRTAKEFQVGGTGKAWKVQPAIDFYANWANNITFRVGDTLRFDINTTDFEVSQVPYTSYEMCIYTGYKWFTKDSSETFAFQRTGVYYFVASKSEYCLQGMRFAASVYNGNGTLVNIDDGGGDGFKTRDIVIAVLAFVAVGMLGGVGAYFRAYLRKCLGCPEKPKAEAEEPEEKRSSTSSLSD